MYRLACAKGPLKNLYHHSYLNHVPNASMLILGLDRVYKSWRGMHPITERVAASTVSVVDVQGVKRCRCKKGNYTTETCACFASKRVCGSQCHGGLNHNFKNCGESV